MGFATRGKQSEPKPIDLTALKQNITPAQIIAYYGSQVEDRKGRHRCLFHADRTPSAFVFDGYIHCFGASCNFRGDVLDVVQRKEGLNFREAAEFLQDLIGKDLIPTALVTDEYDLRFDSKYKGPVPRKWVDYYKNYRTLEHLQWFLSQRLIEKRTLDFMHIGYRPDYSAYTIPFWRGLPGQSEIDVLQYRSSKPDALKRYWGEKYYYRPSLLNAHVINPHFVVLFVGTLDAVLGLQDGLPALSLNGISAFDNPQGVETLRTALRGSQQVFLVPDNTMTEHASALRIAQQIGAQLRLFPKFEGKDYTDYRKHFSAQQFVQEVLKMSEPIFLVTRHRETYRRILNLVGQGKAGKAAEVLDIIFDYVQSVGDCYAPSNTPAQIFNAINRDLQLTVYLGDFMLDMEAGSSYIHKDHLHDLATDICESRDREALVATFRKWADRLTGAF